MHMDPLKSFVAISSAGFVVKIVSVLLDAFVNSISWLGPLAAIVAVVIVILLTVADIIDAYRAGFTGVAILSFQFMPLSWVIGMWVAGWVVGLIIGPIVKRFVAKVDKWQ
jgi:hypothetical protein